MTHPKLTKPQAKELAYLNGFHEHGVTPQSGTLRVLRRLCELGLAEFRTQTNIPLRPHESPRADSCRITPAGRALCDELAGKRSKGERPRSMHDEAVAGYDRGVMTTVDGCQHPIAGKGRGGGVAG